MSVGSHSPVLLDTAVDSLKVRAEGVYVDCTFGRGGHSREILRRLGRRGRVIALDRDPAAIAAHGEIDDERLQLTHSIFSRLHEMLRECGATRVNGILLDLGMSSPQIDDAARGFSFRFDAPLDMRMDTSRGATAAEWLAGADARELVVVQGAQRFEHSHDIAMRNAEFGEHLLGQHRRMLLFRNVILVVFAVMKFARVVKQRDQDRKERIDSFHSGYPVGDGRGAPRMLEQKLRRGLIGLAIETCLGIDEHPFDAGVKAGKVRFQDVSNVIH